MDTYQENTINWLWFYPLKQSITIVIGRNTFFPCRVISFICLSLILLVQKTKRGEERESESVGEEAGSYRLWYAASGRCQVIFDPLRTLGNLSR